MNYKIVGTTAVECTLNAGESMFTQSGGMIWQTEGITMSTNARGGLGRSLGRMLTGESIFMANYTAEKNGAMVAFGTTGPGSIIPIDLSQGDIIAQKGAFLCAEQNVDIKISFTKKIAAGLFGGDGFVLQRLYGKGIAFLEVDGDLVEKVLAPGEVMKVDTGNVVAFESSVNYDIETVSGLGNILFGGEGLFVTKLTGPGRIILQTQSIASFAMKLLANQTKKG